VPITRDHTTDIPITLTGGSQTISLSLVAGNYHPTDYGAPDPSLLSFAIRSVDLSVD
jgi:hypothetical protein